MLIKAKRAVVAATVAALGTLSAGPAGAQQQLPAPSASNPMPHVAKSPAKRKTHIVKTAKPTADASAAPDAHPIADRDRPPADPLSFGMKWNGSNDSAGQTRVQNYDGNATGTGAEVGLKLHF